MSWTQAEWPLVIQKLSSPDAWAPSNEIYLLRDDLIPVALGGNKVRIAGEFLADMRSRGCDALIMYGDRQSNLCRVLALLCRAGGVPCLMVATSEAHNTTSFNERIIQDAGVEVLQCEKDGIAEAVDRAFELLASRGLRPYYIYGNRLGRGNEGVAAHAYARVYRAIVDWERSHNTTFDLIVTPYGTGATQGGLVAGSLLEGDGRSIVGISISSRPKERATEILVDAVCSWLDREGLGRPADLLDHIDLKTAYTLGGYGRFDQRVLDLIQAMMEQEGVPMDPTYSAKAFRGMLDYLADHHVEGARVLFVHTGSLPLFFDHLNART